MNTKEFTCVVCPNGCPIVVNIDNEVTPVMAQVQGSVCKKGEEWGCIRKSKILSAPLPPACL